MSELDTSAGRFRRVAGTFGERVAEVPPHAWSNPSPCEGWTAIDVVDHLVEWVPGVLGKAGLEFPTMPTVEDDPLGAWNQFTATVQAALEDPEVAGRTFDAGPPGEMTVERAVDMLVTGDVLIHTWDLARATGLDATIDESIAGEMLAGMAPMVDALVASGHYGKPVAVPDDADVQTKLIALTGRDPF